MAVCLKIAKENGINGVDSMEVKNYEELEMEIVKENNRLELSKMLMAADNQLTQRYIDKISEFPVAEADKNVKNVSGIRMFTFSKIILDAKEDTKDKLISVYKNAYNLNISVALIIESDENGIVFSIAGRCNKNPALAETLNNSIKANFSGTETTMLESGEIKKHIEKINENKANVVSVSIIPSERDDNKEKFVQNIEKLIDEMQGKKWSAIFLAEPVPRSVLQQQKNGYEGLYSALSPYSKHSYSYGNNKTTSVNTSITRNLTKTVGKNITSTRSHSSSSTSGSTYGGGSSSGSNYNYSGYGSNSGSNSNWSESESYTDGYSFGESIAENFSESDGTGVNKGDSKSSGTTENTTINYENKSVINLMNIADEQIKRIQLSNSLGAWDTSCYFMSDDAAVAMEAASSCMALFSGNNSYIENSHINIWQESRQQKDEIRKILDNICYLVHPRMEIHQEINNEKEFITPTNMLTGKELPIILDLPNKSIKGITVIEMAEFARSITYRDSEYVPKRTIDFSSVYFKGKKENERVNFNIDLFPSHLLITGAAGTGKSYTTYNLLYSLLKKGIKMLVIEPKKGEYKQIFGGYNGMRVYTTDPKVYRMLHINPFQFPENISLNSHIEQVMQILNASWSLYAAMPQILKDAIILAYKKCGWDVNNSIWIEGINDYKYPTFNDVMEILPDIINNSDYSSDSKGDYKGALLTRMKSMTNGINGVIFENSEGVSDKVLFDGNVIIDLSDIGSQEVISLIMGVITMKLNEYRQSQRKSGKISGHDSELMHITVLEEAHNLLRRTSKEQSQEGANIVGQSVEMISNSIKEMRTYGEGFVIIDQSPTSIDVSAVENTGTKIVMGVQTKEAAEELGNALSLNDEQIKELSKLPTGVACAFQRNWLEPALIKVDSLTEEFYRTCNKPIEQSNFKEICIVRGLIAEELYNQHCTKAYDNSRIRMIINNSDIFENKKDELRGIISEYNKEISRRLKEKISISDKLVCEYLFKFVPCKGLFDIISPKNLMLPEQLIKFFDNCSDEKTAYNETENIKNIVLNWYTILKNNIIKYMIVQDEKILKNIVRMMLKNITNDGENKQSVYSTIVLLENTGELF